MSDEYQIVSMPGQQGVPVPPRIDRADFVDKIKPEQIVEVLRHKLLGEEFDGTKWIKIPALQVNALSETGAWEIANLMLGAGSINVSISKLDKNQISARVRNLMKEVLVKILSSWKVYDIKDVGQIYYICSIVFSNALVVLSQADEGSIQELFKTTINEQRMVSSEKKEQPKWRQVLGI